MGGSSGSVPTGPVVEDEYATVRTSVWWDIENCQVPRACDPHLIAQNISSALAEMGYRGPVSISAFGDTSKIAQPAVQALNSTGIALNHVPAAPPFCWGFWKNTKDAAKKVNIKEFMLWLIDFEIDKLLVVVVSNAILLVVKMNCHKKLKPLKMENFNPRTDMYRFGIFSLKILIRMKLRNGTMEVFDMDVIKR
ncbi:hypothetical protein ZIOFF_038290 [Zingiber officinale]|uniref:NYN domain-containing protein n=1 Tax=Zingiber officinale TaxID=94328 RepID=A0A8J5G167_ZINOF|nr:hypothetical protein ZIOFF_038290 [Zingiber officinale]